MVMPILSLLQAHEYPINMSSMMTLFLVQERRQGEGGLPPKKGWPATSSEQLQFPVSAFSVMVAFCLL